MIPVASIREGLEIFAGELEAVIRSCRSWKARVAVACRGNATGGTRVFTGRRQIHPAAPVTGGSAAYDGTNPSPEQAHRVGARFVHALERRSRGMIIAGRSHRVISALSFGAYRRLGTVNGCAPRCEPSAMRSAGVVCAGGQVHSVDLEVSVAGCAAEASPADRVVRAEEARGSTHGRSSSGSRRRRRAAWPPPRRTG